MVAIPDLLAAGRTWSLEFFPPRSEEAERALDEVLAELAPLDPSFASVTYGALGSTRERTRALVMRMNAELSFPTMAHLTSVGHTRRDIADLLDAYARGGVRNILALGGDPPADGSDPGGDFRYAVELVEMVRAHPAGFAVGVAAHPEMHPRSPDRDSDRRHLAAKLRLADFAVTQFFFRVDDYSRLVEELADAGCERPVIPGVMPVINVAGLRRMAAMNRTTLPRGLMARLDAAGDDAEAVADIGVDVAVELCQALIAAGAPGLHLYTLNRAASVRRIVAAVGLGPARRR